MGRLKTIDFARVSRLALVLGAGLTLAHCAASTDKFARRVDPKYGVTASPRVVEFGEPVPKGGGTYRVGKPYVVAGQTYVPEENPGYKTVGMASWYGADFHGRRTANGEIFDMTSITAAHPTMPIPSYARVTNLRNGKSLIVRVNDRGPYHGNRVLDVSVRASKLLEFHDHGLAKVKVEYVGRAPLEGSDDRMLVATLRDGQPAPAPSRVMLASAKPFVPEQGQRLGGNVPVPQGRPYTLGTQIASAAEEIETPPAAESTLNAQASAFDRRFGSGYTSTEGSVDEMAASTARPVSAFSSVRQDSGAGFMAGRGLY